jgi:phage terminase large subunit-like protein
MDPKPATLLFMVPPDFANPSTLAFMRSVCAQRPDGPQVFYLPLDAAQTAHVMDAVDRSTREELLYDWNRIARPEQLLEDAAGDEPWTHLVLMGGAGTGKTRAVAEWLRERVWSGIARNVQIVAGSMEGWLEAVEGPAGILASSPRCERPRWCVGEGRLTWPNGAIADVYSAGNPDRIYTATQDYDTIWAEDVNAWPEYGPLMRFVFAQPGARCAITSRTNAGMSRALHALMESARRRRVRVVLRSLLGC